MPPPPGTCLRRLHRRRNPRRQITETLNTLHFASRARSIVNQATKNLALERRASTAPSGAVPAPAAFPLREDLAHPPGGAGGWR